jgi:CRP/FNR family transcriptional regulator, cyclic AMP receptor protein
MGGLQKAIPVRESATALVGGGERFVPTKPELKAQFDPKSFLTKTAAGITLERFHASQRIYAQGEPADSVGYIRMGRVKVTTVSNRGKEAVAGIFQNGHFFGEASLGGPKVRTTTVVALEECLITLITTDVMLSTLSSEPGFSAFFMAHLLSRNTRLEEDLVDQLLNLSERRLARLLLLLANVDQESGKPAEVNLSQEVLAEWYNPIPDQHVHEPIPQERFHQLRQP